MRMDKQGHCSTGCLQFHEVYVRFPAGAAGAIERPTHQTRVICRHTHANQNRCKDPYFFSAPEAAEAQVLRRRRGCWPYRRLLSPVDTASQQLF